MGDKVGDEVRELFETERRLNNDAQVPTLPTPDAKDQHTLLQQLSDQISAMTREFKELKSDNKEQPLLMIKLLAFAHVTDAKLAGLKTAADSNQADIRESVAASGENVQDGKVQAALERIDKMLASDQVKTSEILTVLCSSRKNCLLASSLTLRNLKSSCRSLLLGNQFHVQNW